jgi:PadR family transcriptional regulator, regulatory protein PadR
VGWYILKYLCRIGLMRKTHALVKVAMALVNDPTGRHWGYELSKKTGVRSGVLYPMLTRMLEEGWVEDGWEDPTTIRDKRPPRRYYELTNKGKLALGAVLRDASHDVRFAGVLTAARRDPGFAGLVGGFA